MSFPNLGAKPPLAGAEAGAAVVADWPGAGAAKFVETLKSGGASDFLFL